MRGLYPGLAIGVRANRALAKDLILFVPNFGFTGFSVRTLRCPTRADKEKRTGDYTNNGNKNKTEVEMGTKIKRVQMQTRRRSTSLKAWLQAS